MKTENEIREQIELLEQTCIHEATIPNGDIVKLTIARAKANALKWILESSPTPASEVCERSCQNCGNYNQKEKCCGVVPKIQDMCVPANRKHWQPITEKQNKSELLPLLRIVAETVFAQTGNLVIKEELRRLGIIQKGE